LWLAPAVRTASGEVTDSSQSTIATVGVDGMMQIYAAKYNVSLSVAKRIVACESHNDPQAIRLNKTKAGVVWSEDIGLFQINSFYWQSYFKDKMGLDITKPDDNLKAGFWILANYGTSPWLWSKPCWG